MFRWKIDGQENIQIVKILYTVEIIHIKEETIVAKVAVTCFGYLERQY